ncbi:hypothetical protein DERF_004491 [Dermatophagoides farinae]|uniref:Uncharacterized protein n=1 Tax=Dermatophagoides farinae TaxID=6954 RepID=A0A922I676_DERFA|nr:hypothetical protein DERF_004491 [Dermatophagoides farinae]
MAKKPKLSLFISKKKTCSTILAVVVVVVVQPTYTSSLGVITSLLYMTPKIELKKYSELGS